MPVEEMIKGTIIENAQEFHRKKTEDQIKAIQQMDPSEPFIPEGIEELTLPLKLEKKAESKVDKKDESKKYADRFED